MLNSFSSVQSTGCRSTSVYLGLLQGNGLYQYVILSNTVKRHPASFIIRVQTIQRKGVSRHDEQNRDQYPADCCCLAETPSLFYYWYIYFLYSPICLHNKLMLSTYITTYFPSKQNVRQYPYKQGWTKKKIVCSFVYFTQLCIYISNKMHCFPAHISAKHNICRLISMVLSMLVHSLNPH